MNRGLSMNRYISAFAALIISSSLYAGEASKAINQMKDSAIKEIRDASIKIAVDSVKNILTTSVDKSKLDNLFQKSLDETKEELKRINS